MFWDTGYSNSANIDALLNKDNCALKELLDDEDILQECKSQNQKLIKFLNRPEIVDELVTLIVTEPSVDLDEKQRFLHPNVACEILTCDVPALKQRIVEEPSIMAKLCDFFEQQAPPLNPLLASFVCKTFGTLITKKMEQDWFLYQTICLQVLEYIKSRDTFLDVLVRHFATPVVMDLLLNMLNDIEDAKMKCNFLAWVNEKGMITRMIDVLRDPAEGEKHAMIAQFLTELIKTDRCNRQNDTEDRKNLPSPLLQTMESVNTATQLLDVILSDARCESGILAGMQVLLCLLENPIIQEPVSHTALQQMMDAEKEHHDEIVTSLLGTIAPRVAQLFELLVNPPTRDPNTIRLTSPPLGIVRLQLCYLFTVLLETENTSIIEGICATNFFTELLMLFKQYCWNNFLHNNVRKCLVYSVQAFDTVPNSTQLVISALQKHIVVECKVAEKLMDVWHENDTSTRRLGYMGHLIDIIGAIQSTTLASEEFRALLESNLTTNENGDSDASAQWQRIMETAESELKLQQRLLADCDPALERQDYGRDGLNGFPSIPDESENDAEDFNYHFNASMHSAMNEMNGEFPEDFNGDDDMESRSKMFEDVCGRNSSSYTMDSDFNDWTATSTIDSNHDFPFDFTNSLTLKSATSPFDTKHEGDEDDNDDDPFAGSSNSFDANFADFDSHFSEMKTGEGGEQEEEQQQHQLELVTEPCFVATTQIVEISTLPPVPRDFQLGGDVTAKLIVAVPLTAEELEDDEFFSLRDDSNEMSSLTDDNDRKFLENTEVPLDDEDDDFASADESSSKGNSEEETNSAGEQFSDCTTVAATAVDSSEQINGNADDDSSTERNDSAGDEPKEQSELNTSASDPSKLMDKFIAQANDGDAIKTQLHPQQPLVPLENGTA